MTARRTWRVARTAAIGVIVASAVAALAMCVAIWPVKTALLFVLLAVAILAWRAPVAGLLAALFLFGLEGSVKMLLAMEVTPSADAVGAATLDLALLIAMAGVVIHDRGRSLRWIWGEASYLERAVLLLIPAWLAISVLQIPRSGDLAHGLDGFRLTQGYVLLALGGIVAFGRLRRRSDGWELRALLWLIVAVAGYAVFRAVTGPTPDELSYVLGRSSNTAYQAGLVRTFGSLSSAVSLVSFLTPAVVFALVVGVFIPARRPLAWSGACLGTAAILTSYTRIGLVALAVTAFLIAIITIPLRSVPLRRKALMAGVAISLVAALGTGTLLASQGSGWLEARARGLVHPTADPNFRNRLHVWGDALDAFQRQPLGRGLGTVGRATSLGDSGKTVTTDNSYVKLLVEQGYGAALFVAGVVGLCVLTVRRLLRSAPPYAGIGLAALGGFLSFTILWTAGEYIELPGKVLAWTLLGVSLSLAFRGWAAGKGNRGELTEASTPELRQVTPWLWWRLRAQTARSWMAWGLVVLVLTGVPAVLSLTRQEGFRASITISPLTGRTFPEPYNLSYLNRLKEEFSDRALAAVGNPGDVPAADTIGERKSRRGGDVVLTVSGSTPQRAADLAHESGAQLAAFASKALKSREARVTAAEAELNSGDLSPGQSAAASRRLQEAKKAIREHPGRFAVGHVKTSAMTRLSDRDVDALPGPLPPRPRPVWAALAGLLVAGVLFLAWILRPPREAASGEARMNTLESGIGQGC